MLDDEPGCETVTAHVRAVGPPEAEIPWPLCQGPFVWRSTHAVVALLAPLVYSSGVEMTLLGRTRNSQSDDLLSQVRTLDTAVHGHPTDQHHLRLSVFASDELIAIESLGGEQSSHAFRRRVWIPAIDDLVLGLAWDAAAIPYAEHELTGVARATADVTLLWR